MGRQIRDRTALVTGASRGIGRLLSEELARQGANLLINARTEAPLIELAEQLSQSAHVRVIPVSADITTDEGRHRLIQNAEDHFGGLDMLINNAGVASFGEFATSSESILRQIMELNFFAPVELTRLAIPLLARAADLGRDPVILNMGSICGRRGIPSLSEHCASKHALAGFTEALRGELARFDIDVCLVVPGKVRAEDRADHMLRNEGRIHLGGEHSQESVVRAVIDTLKKRHRERLVGWTTRWIWRGQQFMPRFMDWIFARKVKNFRE